jgi:hypothetical protein
MWSPPRDVTPRPQDEFEHIAQHGQACGHTPRLDFGPAVSLV